MKAAVALLALTALVACQKESAPSGLVSTSASPKVAAAAVPALRVSPLGPLRVAIPDGYAILNAAPNGVDLRHVDGLSATLGAVTRTTTAQDEQTILTFLAEAEADLKKIPHTVVTRVVRTLPGTQQALRGLAAFTGNPEVPEAPRQKRAFWVLTGASVIVTASFILVEDSAADDALVERLLAELRDAVKASEAKP